MYSMSRSPRKTPRLVLAAAVLAVGLPALGSEPLDLPDELAVAIASDQLKTVDELRLLQQQVRKVVAAARPVTVAVELNDSVGSGVIVSAEGLVLTAGHVCAEPNRRVWIRFPDNRRVEGRSLGVDHDSDSGLVQITDKPSKLRDKEEAPDEGEGAEAKTEAWPFVPLAEEPVELGEWVIGLGQPNGFVEGRTPPVRLGRVLYTEEDSINTDATLVGGDSGGPLLNLRGEVVGIHSKIGKELSKNYHVPVATYRRDWERLMSGRLVGLPEGEDPDDWRPQLGLAVRLVDERVVVTQVFADRPADEAGIEVGDELLELDGTPIESPKQLGRLLQKEEAYDRVPLIAGRDGTRVELEVWLGRSSTDYPGSALVQEGR